MVDYRRKCCLFSFKGICGPKSEESVGFCLFVDQRRVVKSALNVR